MLHNHSGFDRTDPDVRRAIDDSLEPAASLLNERAKPQPRSVDDLRAWRGQIAELEERLALIARRVGMTVDELILEAGDRLRRNPLAALAVPAPSGPKPDAPPPSRKQRQQQLAADNLRIAGELEELTRQMKDLEQRFARKAAEQQKIHRKLFVGRGRG